MDIDNCNAERGKRFHRPGDGCGNIVKLDVEEDRPARSTWTSFLFVVGVQAVTNSLPLLKTAHVLGADVDRVRQRRPGITLGRVERHGPTGSRVVVMARRRPPSSRNWIIRSRSRNHALAVALVRWGALSELRDQCRLDPCGPSTRPTIGSGASLRQGACAPRPNLLAAAGKPPGGFNLKFEKADG